MFASSTRRAPAFLRWLDASLPHLAALSGRSSRRRARAGHRQVRQVFLVALGGIYLLAFTSLGRQVRGLYGARGILPVKSTLR